MDEFDELLRYTLEQENLEMLQEEYPDNEVRVRALDEENVIVFIGSKDPKIQKKENIWYSGFVVEEELKKQKEKLIKKFKKKLREVKRNG